MIILVLLIKKSNIKIIIGCPIHGWFEQTPNSHLSNRGCYDCGKETSSSKQKLSIESFISKARIKHNNKYDYSRVIYKNSETKVIIGCPEHSWFEQKANNHLYGKGCIKCGHILTGNKKSSSLEEFIYRARKIHDDKYDYSRVIYKNSETKVIIGCPEHSWFEQKANAHLLGKGCFDCGIEATARFRTFSSEEIIQKFKEVHGKLYDYSEINYQGTKNPIKIRCYKHGFFYSLPDNHLKGSGCSRCQNKAEGRLAEYLEKKMITHRSYKIDGYRKLYDFYLPDHNLIIERDGEQHYFDIEFFSQGNKKYIQKQQENDRYKTELAKKHGYKIARIPYWLNDEQVEKEIDNILAGNPSYPDVPDLKQAETKPLPK